MGTQPVREAVSLAPGAAPPIQLEAVPQLPVPPPQTIVAARAMAGLPTVVTSATKTAAKRRERFMSMRRLSKLGAIRARRATQRVPSIGGALDAGSPTRAGRDARRRADAAKGSTARTAISRA
jgi:hypothetical protein